MAIAAFSLSAFADLKSSDPEQACTYLADSGLPTRGWKVLTSSYSGCSSAYKDIGTGFPLANNLAYYATGDSAGVNELKLVVNLNQPNDSAAAIEALSNTAKKLSETAAGKPLPASIEQAIKGRKAAGAKVGVTHVQVVRDNWPTGSGYELQVIFK